MSDLVKGIIAGTEVKDRKNIDAAVAATKAPEDRNLSDNMSIDKGLRNGFVQQRGGGLFSR